MEDNRPMSMASLEQIADGLSHRCGYSLDRASVLAAQISKLDPSLHDAFWSWWSSGHIPETPAVEGRSVKTVIEHGICRSVPVAFTWLNAFILNPRRTLELSRASYHIVITEIGSGLPLLDS